VEVNKSWMCNAGRDLDRYLDRERSTARYKNQALPYEEAMAKFTCFLQEYHSQNSGRALAIASTFGSDEEIQGFIALFKTTLGTTVYFKTDSVLNREEYPADQLLITDDKNPNRYTLVNTHGLQEIQDATPTGDLDLLVMWGEGLKNSLSSAKITELLSKAKVKVLLTAFAEAGMERYDLVIPTPAFIAKSGTFTNVDGKKSHFNAAIVETPQVKEEVVVWSEAQRALQNVPCGV
jgi:hypothetical protein